MRRNDIVETVVNAVVNNVDFPKSVAKFVDEDNTGIFEEIYNELEAMGVSTIQYVKQRTNARGYCMCKRCNNEDGIYDDYERKGIFVSKDYANRKYKNGKIWYSPNKKGNFRLLITLRANCYGDDEVWVNGDFQAHRIDDSDGYRVGNLVLIPRKKHDVITNFLRKHREITNTLKLMEEMGIMAEIRKGWQVQAV